MSPRTPSARVALLTVASFAATPGAVRAQNPSGRRSRWSNE